MKDYGFFSEYKNKEVAATFRIHVKKGGWIEVYKSKDGLENTVNACASGPMNQEQTSDFIGALSQAESMAKLKYDKFRFFVKENPMVNG